MRLTGPHRRYDFGPTRSSAPNHYRIKPAGAVCIGPVRFSGWRRCAGRRTSSPIRGAVSRWYLTPVCVVVFTELGKGRGTGVVGAGSNEVDSRSLTPASVNYCSCGWPMRRAPCTSYRTWAGAGR